MDELSNDLVHVLTMLYLELNYSQEKPSPKLIWKKYNTCYKKINELKDKENASECSEGSECSECSECSDLPIIST